MSSIIYPIFDRLLGPEGLASLRYMHPSVSNIICLIYTLSGN